MENVWQPIKDKDYYSFGNFSGYKTEEDIREDFNEVFSTVECVAKNAYSVGIIMKKSKYNFSKIEDILANITDLWVRDEENARHMLHVSRNEIISLAQLKVASPEDGGECTCCYNQVQQDNVRLECPNCEFNFCSQCLRKHFEVQSLEGDRLLIPCPGRGCGCGCVIDGESLQRELPPEYARAYKEKIFGDFLKSGSVTRCRNCRSYRYIGNLSAGDRSGHIKCQYCHKRWCGKCHTMKHSPISCEMAADWRRIVDVRLNKYFDSNIQRCPDPKCRSPIFKDGGCRHMQCSRCKVKFCWVCMRAIPEGVSGWVHDCKPSSLRQSDRVRGFEIEAEVRQSGNGNGMELTYGQRYLQNFEKLHVIDGLLNKKHILELLGSQYLYDDRLVLYQVLFDVVRSLMFSEVFEYYMCARKPQNRFLFFKYRAKFDALESFLQVVFSSLTNPNPKSEEEHEDSSSTERKRNNPLKGALSKIVELYNEFQKSLVEILPYLKLDYEVKLDNIEMQIKQFQLRISGDYFQNDDPKIMSSDKIQIVNVIPNTTTTPHTGTSIAGDGDGEIRRRRAEEEEVNLVLAKSLSEELQREAFEREMQTAMLVSAEEARFQQQMDLVRVMELSRSEAEKKENEDVFQKELEVVMSKNIDIDIMGLSENQPLPDLQGVHCGNRGHQTHQTQAMKVDGDEPTAECAIL